MGGVPGAGRIVGGKAPLRTKDLLKTMQQIRTSIPVMKAMKLDEDLCKLLLAQMVQMHHVDGLQLIIPEEMVV